MSTTTIMSATDGDITVRLTHTNDVYYAELVQNDEVIWRFASLDYEKACRNYLQCIANELACTAEFPTAIEALVV